MDKKKGRKEGRKEGRKGGRKEGRERERKEGRKGLLLPHCLVHSNCLEDINIDACYNMNLKALC